ncbi:MAG: oxidoreductase family protein [Mariniblastus sp.]
MFELSKTICEITGASSCQLGEVLQSLWSGYGVIQRVELEHPKFPVAIVKHIDLSQARENRRGWSGDVSHQRKVQSYEIEKTFYERYAEKCNDCNRTSAATENEGWASCRVPKMLAAFEKPDSSGWLLVLEDLDESGFNLRSSIGRCSTEQNLNACLRWLANFHARFMGCEPEGLWPIGTYWHVSTRQEELQAMESGQLKRFAEKIDQRLNEAQFQTLVHGDAKLANFCFRDVTGEMELEQDDAKTVAAVDFQYVGGGCGMKDVAYLVSSCLDGSESESQQSILLDVYFRQLKESLTVAQPEIDFESLESEWRELYAFAWADFCRFLAGWSPGHWKLNKYNDRVTRSVLAQLSAE